MVETFFRPSRPTLIQQVRDELASRMGTGPLLPRSVLEAFAVVQGGLAHMQHGHLDFIARQILPTTSEAQYLERHASEFGINRKAATFSIGPCDFTGTTGTDIPAGTLVRRVDGVDYTTDALATVDGGTVTVQVTAAVAADAGDAAAGQVVSLTSPISGIDSAGVVGAGGLINGADQELDADLLARLLVRKRTVPQGGADADYVKWALEVPEITRAWALPLYTGIGKVSATFVTDNLPSIIPDAAKVAEVQAYIDDVTRRPVTAAFTAFAPTTTALDAAITLTPNVAAVQKTVDQALLDLITRKTKPGGTLLLSEIREAISTADGEENHVLTSPVADVVAPAGSIHIRGTTVFS